MKTNKNILGLIGKGLSEHEIQKQILYYLTLKKIFHWRNNTGVRIGEYKGKKTFVRYGAIGSPDIFAMRYDKCYGIEVKSAKGKQSDTQKEFEKDFINAGGIYILAKCLDVVVKQLY